MPPPIFTPMLIVSCLLDWFIYLSPCPKELVQVLRVKQEFPLMFPYGIVKHLLHLLFGFMAMFWGMGCTSAAAELWKAVYRHDEYRIRQRV